MSPCILVKANKNGYRRIGKDGIEKYAHVIAYEEAFGEISQSYEIHHLCLVKNCVNPFHLQAVTRKEHRTAHSQDGRKGGYTHAQFLADRALDEYECDRDHDDLELRFWVDFR